MANKEAKSEKLSTWDKVVAWYSKQAYAVGIVYSVGAAVVIIGALFKILHWPGASQVLMVGMFTEALLFILGIFEKPHAAYHWENVFPQLIGEETKELLGGNGVAAAPATAATAATTATPAAVPALDEKELKNLQDGIANLSKTATQLAGIGEAATATHGLVEKLNAAGAAAQSFAGTQDALLAATEGLTKQYQTIHTEMEGVAAQTAAYTKGVENINKSVENVNKGIENVSSQLTALNAVYELQLKGIQAQADAYKAQTEKIQSVTATVDTLSAHTAQMTQTAATALEAGKQYVAAQQKLAAQVADLNKVYGNMLSAL